MHSSRMRTGRPLTVYRSLLPGGVCSQGGVVCLLWGRGVYAPGGVCFQGGGIPACTEADTPDPLLTESQTWVKT